MFEDDVVSVLSHVNPRPDGLNGKVLKVCATQLVSVFTRLFQLLLDTQFVPRLWRLSTIIPVCEPRSHYKQVSSRFRYLVAFTLQQPEPE